MNKIKGDKYEDYVCNYLNTKSIAWLWRNCPEKHLLKSGLITDQNKYRLYRKDHKKNINPIPDTGIDIVQLDNDEYIFVQCKNGYKNGLTFKDLLGFSIMMMEHDDRKGAVYHTSKLSKLVYENHINPRIKYIYFPMNVDDEGDPIPDYYGFEDDIEKKQYYLYDYQKEALDSIQKWFKTHNRGILSMPCGTGKTIISCFFAKNYENVVIISRLKQFAEQNVNRFMSYFPDFKSIIIDSEYTRKPERIYQWMGKNKNRKLLFSVTYASTDILNIILEELKDPIIILDEFHNLSKNNLLNQDDEIYKLLHSNQKILFMSATPRVYELEKTQYENETFDDIFGGVCYHMDFKTAIEKKYICDYRIFLPSVSENYKDIEKEIQKEINIKNIDNEIKAKCIFLFKCLLHQGAQKCIVYCKNINEIKLFKKTIKKLDEYYCLKLKIFTICSEDFHSKNMENYDKKSREWKLWKFENTDQRTVILSVKILDECIDIQKCDSIYITYNTQSKVRTIQRLSRCLRKVDINKNKIGNVFIWIDEYAQILETLSGIKEYDEAFKNKISLQIAKLEKNTNQTNENEIKDQEKIKKYIILVKEFKMLTFNEMLDRIKKYIDTHKKLPSPSSKNYTINYMGRWLSRKKFKLQKKTLKNSKNYKIWNTFIVDPKYSKYFKNWDIY